MNCQLVKRLFWESTLQPRSDEELQNAINLNNQTDTSGIEYYDGREPARKEAYFADR